MREDPHYLRLELSSLIQTDPRIFAFLEEGSLDGTWYWDLTQPEHEWMSPRFWEVLGYEASEMPHLASAWQEMINPEDLEAAIQAFQAHCADPNHPYDQIVRYTHKAGHIVWIRCRGIAIRDEEGVPIRMLGAHQDITALKNTEAQLRGMNASLLQANEDLRRFSYAASHDIRSPAITLKALLSHVQEQHAESLDAEGKKLIELALRQAARMAEMADRVLDYARVARAEAELQSLDLGLVVAETLEGLSEAISGAKAKVSVSAMPTVLVDRVMMRIALQNLIENALKYNASPEPQIEISGSVQGQRWSLSVADNGIGVPQAQRERIFQVFERLHRHDDYTGTGLGLAMCAQVAAMHGGQVRVSDNTPQGTVFTLDLSAHPPVS